MNDLSQPRTDIYRTITDSIIEAIKAGAGKFVMPWHGGGIAIGKPENALTRMQYNGVNVLMLWVRAYKEGFPTGHWASYRQWQRLGAQVEKGAKATPIIFYKQIENDQNEEETGTRLFARSSSVFNAAQIRGWTPPPDHHLTGHAVIATCVADFISATLADVTWGGGAAYYHIPTDRIHMPDRERFRATDAGTADDGLHSTMLHELVHWTGAKHRLARFENGLPRDAVPFEELVAEIGAAFLCADLGISVTPRPDHAAYVAHWLSAMESDSRAIFRASRFASRAAKYLHELVTLYT